MIGGRRPLKGRKPADRRVRVERPHSAFFRRYVEANRPVILTGVMESWPAAGRWTPEYLAEVAGDHRGEVIVSANGLYPDYITQPSPMAKVEMPVSEFLRRAGGQLSLIHI